MAPQSNKGFLLILSSPSGAGKTTICNFILQSFDSFKMSVSATTRQPRAGEQHGREYFFLSKAEFEEQIKKDAFLEHAKVFTNLYGTPKDFVLQNLNAGTNILFDIDYQGARQIKMQNQSGQFDIVSMFLMPPSLEVLRQRLTKRGLDSLGDIEIRLKTAEQEMQHTKEYNYCLVNDNLEDCKNEVKKIITLEIKKRLV
jgi:guanylate kinase